MTPEKLLETLTLDQKLAQLTGEGSPESLVTDGRFDAEKARQKFPHGLGALMVPIDLSPEEIGEWFCQMRSCLGGMTSPLKATSRTVSGTL